MKFEFLLKWIIYIQLECLSLKHYIFFYFLFFEEKFFPFSFSIFIFHLVANYLQYSFFFCVCIYLLILLYFHFVREKRLHECRNDSAVTIYYVYVCIDTQSDESNDTFILFYTAVIAASAAAADADAYAIFSIFRKKKYFSVEFILTLCLWEKKRWKTKRLSKAIEIDR